MLILYPLPETSTSPSPVSIRILYLFAMLFWTYREKYLFVILSLLCFAQKTFSSANLWPKQSSRRNSMKYPEERYGGERCWGGGGGVGLVRRSCNFEFRVTNRKRKLVSLLQVVVVWQPFFLTSHSVTFLHSSWIARTGPGQGHGLRSVLLLMSKVLSFKEVMVVSCTWSSKNMGTKWSSFHTATKFPSPEEGATNATPKEVV